MIYNFDGHSPVFRGERIFVAPGADLIGRVVLEEDTSVWFNVTLRGDIELITIASGSNVQDGSSIHTDRGKPVIIGPRVTVGHNCVIHGCVIGEGSLIGMGSTILSGARIGKGCLVGAGSLVTGNMNAPDGTLLLGSPAKAIKPLDRGMAEANLKNSHHYVVRKDHYISEGINARPSF